MAQKIKGLWINDPKLGYIWSLPAFRRHNLWMVFTKPTLKRILTMFIDGRQYVSGNRRLVTEIFLGKTRRFRLVTTKMAPANFSGSFLEHWRAYCDVMPGFFDFVFGDLEYCKCAPDEEPHWDFIDYDDVGVFTRILLYLLIVLRVCNILVTQYLGDFVISDKNNTDALPMQIYLATNHSNFYYSDTFLVGRTTTEVSSEIGPRGCKGEQKVLATERDKVMRLMHPSHPKRFDIASWLWFHCQCKIRDGLQAIISNRCNFSGHMFIWGQLHRLLFNPTKKDKCHLFRYRVRLHRFEKEDGFMSRIRLDQ